MNMQARYQLALSVLPRYLKADNKAKKLILDEYYANTGYHSAHIERKSWTCVRKIFAYICIDTALQVVKINELFRGPLRLYINFFLPSMRCIEKRCIGSKIVKTYDQARTPYQRVLESQGVSEKTKDRLRILYNQLNPVVLKHEIDRLIQGIFDEKLTKRRKAPA